MLVPGSGPQPAVGMIVGEAPGRREVELGEPFVGRSGQLLDRALGELGVYRRTLYVTNVVKEMPVDSDGKIRKPFQSEIDAWWPILKGEIEQTNPKAILALGKTARGVLAPHGWDQTVCAWHPAYVLRNGGENEYIWEDWLEQIRPFAEIVR